MKPKTILWIVIGIAVVAVAVFAFRPSGGGGGTQNVDAVGAWVEVRAGDRTWSREITVGGGHGGGQLGWLHIGLGPFEDAEVRVQWPDGDVGPWTDVEADRFVELRRGAEPSTWSPPE